MIILNSNITTPLSSNVIEAMKPFRDEAVDLSSVDKFNQSALKAYKEAIDKIYLSIRADDEDDIILTSSVSEATSQIFYSVYLKYILTGRKNSIIISQRAPIEEIKIARFLESQGVRVHRIPVTIDGTFDIDVFKEYISSKTALVSLPLVDDESGVIQPLEEVSQICSLYNVALYSNANSAIGVIPVDVARNSVDFLSFSANSLFGPKDIAALYIKKNAAIELQPLIYGKDFEQAGLREMPRDIAKVIGFGKALEDAIDALEFDIEDVRELRDNLEQSLLEIEGAYSLAPWALRVPNISIMAFENVHASILKDYLASKDILIYSFATLKSPHFERVSLVELNSLPSYLKHCVVGFALNTQNSEEEIETTIKEVKEAVKNIREISVNCKEESNGKS
ncbi:MAG: aminotransferase class V-fold PLP-dependent enzyme [Epsilonproteobacteria bacterium]|nr:aminotransferase class V-fold PLP-dependent enzyme [Campylobacterota bacterium]